MNFSKLGQIFCEVNSDGSAGKPSFARVSLAVVLAFCLGWVTEILVHTKWQQMPDMAGVIGFASAWGGLIYGASKGFSVFDKRGNGQEKP